MSVALITVIATLLILLLIGAPVVMAIGTAAMSYFLVQPDMLSNLIMYAHRMFTGMDSFIYICIPLFMISGELMGRTGLMDRIVSFCRIFVGRLRGGIAYVTILASMIFGCISGSGLACIAARGPIEISMTIPAVMFAGLASVSVGSMFTGCLVPGILLGVAQMIVVAIMAKKYGFPKSDVHYSKKEALQIILNSFGAIFMVLIVLGGILSGVFTATEASAIAVVYVLLLDILMSHKLKAADIWAALKSTAKGSTSIFLIIGFSSVISWILAMESVPIMISNWCTAANISPYLLLFIFNVFCLFNGMWISDSAQLVLFAPIFVPIFSSMGVSPVHIGVVMVVNVMIGMLTPPFGMALYTTASVSGCDLKKIVKASLPFTAVCAAILFIVTYCPTLTIALPQFLGYTT